MCFLEKKSIFGTSTHFLILFIYFLSHHAKRRILVAGLGVEPLSPALEVWGLNY